MVMKTKFNPWPGGIIVFFILLPVWLTNLVTQTTAAFTRLTDKHMLGATLGALDAPTAR